MPMKIYMFHKRENAARAAAFIEADIKHKENPSSVVDLLPISRLKDFPPEKPELYNISADPGEKNNLCKTASGPCPQDASQSIHLV
ncbi:MAG: hypothetical protein HN558_09385 [Gemmatimonadetes bacterium]|jgi:hypothetical protein|nr:hypothetical protein [Gemmatimonadota bacterium]